MRLTWDEFEKYDLPSKFRQIMSNDGKSRTVFYDDTKKIMVVTDSEGVTLTEVDN